MVVAFLGLPFMILYIEFVKPKKGTTMETIGKPPNPGMTPRKRIWELAGLGLGAHC